MTRGLLRGVLLSAVILLVTGSTAMAQQGDSVTGTVRLTGAPVPGFDGIIVNAHSGPTGENPHGTVTITPTDPPELVVKSVTCLTVEGNVARIALADFSGLGIQIRDLPGGDEVRVILASSCPVPASAAEIPITVVSGDLSVVDDEDIHVDGDVARTTGGGLLDYTFDASESEGADFYEWTVFRNGEELAGPLQGPVVTHAFPEPGRYEVELVGCNTKRGTPVCVTRRPRFQVVIGAKVVAINDRSNGLMEGEVVDPDAECATLRLRSTASSILWADVVTSPLGLAPPLPTNLPARLELLAPGGNWLLEWSACFTEGGQSFNVHADVTSEDAELMQLAEVLWGGLRDESLASNINDFAAVQRIRNAVPRSLTDNQCGQPPELAFPCALAVSVAFHRDEWLAFFRVVQREGGEITVVRQLRQLFGSVEDAWDVIQEFFKSEVAPEVAERHLARSLKDATRDERQAEKRLDNKLKALKRAKTNLGNAEGQLAACVRTRCRQQTRLTQVLGTRQLELEIAEAARDSAKEVLQRARQLTRQLERAVAALPVIRGLVDGIFAWQERSERALAGTTTGDVLFLACPEEDPPPACG
jgi:hypothetical protein